MYANAVLEEARREVQKKKAHRVTVSDDDLT